MPNDDFRTGHTDYLILNSDHFHLSIDLDAHRPENAPKNIIRLDISNIDNNGLNHERGMKALKRFSEALSIEFEGGIVSKETYHDETSCTGLTVELSADPKNVDRQRLYDAVKEGFDRANVIYEKHLKEKPDRQRTKLEEAMAAFDGQTVTPELRQQMADVLVKKIFSPEKTK